MKKIKPLKNIFRIILVLILLVSVSGCSMFQKEKSEKKKLNIFMDKTDQYSSSVIKLLVDNFKTDNPKVEIKLNDVLEAKGNIMETINIGTEIDVIFTNRNTIIELSKKGVLSDLQSTYEKMNIKNRYYDIISSYGRVGDAYYGIGVVPYSIELFYNKDYLKKLQISNPANLEEWLNVLKEINGKGIKTPVVLTEDVDVNAFLFSLIASKTINIHDIEENYDSGEESYLKLKDMQGVFKEFDSLTKGSGITRNSFEMGGEQSINSFNNGDYPLFISNSYYNYKLNGSSIGVIGDYNSNSKYGSNLPIIINSLLSVPVNAKNGDVVNEFIKYIYGDEVQAKIVQKGIISGNKLANNKITGISKIMVEHIHKANDNSILILYNLPERIRNGVLLALRKILDGGYTGNEWEDIIKDYYK
jgi:raffinose/stachyose/melibiose transport system substrate-binding protein